MKKTIFLEDKNGKIRLIDRRDGTVLMTAIGNNGDKNNWITTGKTAEEMAQYIQEIGRPNSMKIVEVIEH